jgi:hypothetical protein
MAFKPMDEREFRRLIKIVGWSLKKSGFDYSLLNEKGNYVCTIKITHGKNTKGGEIPAYDVKKTEKMFKQEGLKWPPKKK